MESLKIDFKIDVITGEILPVKELKECLKEKKPRKRGNYYYSEVADYYYQQKYGKNIVEVLSEFYDIPRCPVTGDYVSYTLYGSIKFGKYSKRCSASEFSKHIAENNKGYKAHVERMKIDRKGDGNPMFGKETWNKGLTKESDDRIKKISEDRIGLEFSKETLNKMSESAKVRDIHGHAGFKHSEETKQILREKTIQRLKDGKFPQTNSLPHRIVREMLEELDIEFTEEEEVAFYSFDFKVGNTLVEVQGDYWHCNPNTRHAVPKFKSQINNVNRDKRKKTYIKNNTDYKIMYIWEYDIVNNKENVKLCLKDLKK